MVFEKLRCGAESQQLRLLFITLQGLAFFLQVSRDSLISCLIRRMEHGSLSARPITFLQDFVDVTDGFRFVVTSISGIDFGDHSGCVSCLHLTNSGHSHSVFEGVTRGSGFNKNSRSFLASALLAAHVN